MFKKSILLIALLALVMLFSFSASLSASPIAEDLSIPPYPPPRAGEGFVTMQHAASYLLQYAGMTEGSSSAGNTLGTYPRDHIQMAQNSGLFEGVDFVQGKECSMADYLKMAANLGPLYDALHATPMAPFFYNGVPQPIFKLNDRVIFVVYVESNYDTDEDGKLDLIKVVVEVPKPALEGQKFASVYEPIPYSAGTNASPSQPPYEAAVGSTYDQTKLYSQPAPRIPAGETTTAAHAALAKSTDWAYHYGPSSGTVNAYTTRDSYNYFLVRGYAVILCAGRGTCQSEGISTCGTDVEVDGFAAAVRWLAGEAKGYTNKTDNIEIKADWSNGCVGTHGTSYGGTTQFGMAMAGVNGLKAIVPVAGIASWYEYTNMQGTYNTLEYTQYLGWYVDSRYNNESPLGIYTNADHVRTLQSNNNWYGRYWRQIRTDQATSTGDYFTPHWSSRDYTNPDYGYFSPSKLKTPALIVHGMNDENVRPKQSDLMAQCYEKAGVTYKMLLTQGVHIEPRTYRGGIYHNYMELLNRWFAHYLYDIPNGVEDMPQVTVESNVNGTQEYYDSWLPTGELQLKHADPVAKPTTTINSNYSSHSPAISSTNFRNLFLAGDTPHSTILSSVRMTEDTVIKGATEIKLRAAVNNLTLPDLGSFVVPEPNTPDLGENAIYFKDDGDLDWDAIQKGLDAGDIDHNTVMWLLTFIPPAADSTPAPEPGDYAATAISRGDNLIVSALLVDISDSPFQLYIAPGTSTMSYVTIQSGGIWNGGGLAATDLRRSGTVAAPQIGTTGKYYEVVGYGRLDMANQGAKYDSRTADRKDRVDLIPGEYYDFSVFTVPNVYRVKAGHTLAVVVFCTYPGMGIGQPTTAQGQYTITIDNENSYASIPLGASLESIKVTKLPNKTVYIQGENLDFNGLGVTAYYSDGSSAPVTGYTTDLANGMVLNATGTVTVTVSYGEKSDSFTVNVGNYNIFLKPEKTVLTAGETFTVDVILQGNLNYTQLATEIAYDAGLLEFTNFANLQGWAASVTESGVGKVAVRSVPAMNMVAGTSCTSEFKVVTLEFKVKDSFSGDSTTTNLGFATALVTPAGGVTGTVALGYKPVSIELNKPVILETLDVPEAVEIPAVIEEDDANE